MTAAQTRVTRWGIVALALTGAGIGGYLTLTHWAEEPVICGGLGSCATVRSSEYAEVGGVPVALLGLLLYLAIGVLAGVAGGRSWGMLAVFGLALSGVLYSGYLTWVELFVLEAICLWCVASAVVIAAIMLLAGAAMLVSTPPQRADVPRRA
ncbi:MAG: vitamin K epoxide reductase family protein [Dehalococcoidia bacterium]